MLICPVEEKGETFCFWTRSWKLSSMFTLHSQTLKVTLNFRDKSIKTSINFVLFTISILYTLAVVCPHLILLALHYNTLSAHDTQTKKYVCYVRKLHYNNNIHIKHNNNVILSRKQEKFVKFSSFILLRRSDELFTVMNSIYKMRWWQLVLFFFYSVAQILIGRKIVLACWKDLIRQNHTSQKHWLKQTWSDWSDCVNDIQKCVEIFTFLWYFVDWLWNGKECKVYSAENAFGISNQKKNVSFLYFVVVAFVHSCVMRFWKLFTGI